jgi:hypothetical protein
MQLVVHAWLSSRCLNVLPSPPNFVDILERIQMASYQLPLLPGIYHDLTFTIKSPATAYTPTTSASFGGTTASDLSTITGVTRRPPGNNQLPLVIDQTNKNCNLFVRNADPDAGLQSLIPAHLQLHNIIKNDAVPLNDINQPMCLSYHLRRGCWSQCKRAHDQNRQLSAPERQRVVSFVNNSFPPTTATIQCNCLSLPSSHRVARRTLHGATPLTIRQES